MNCRNSLSMAGRYARSRMDLSLFFAGTAGSVPSARRGLPATLLRRGGDRVLFDCGEGTQRQLIRSVGLRLTHVFLTHFHADHWLGLPGMLKSFELRDRDRPLTVLGPPGTGELEAHALRLRQALLPVRDPRARGRARRCASTTGTSRRSRSSHRGARLRLRDRRGPGAGRFDAELAVSSASRSAPTSAGSSAARRSTASARAGHRPRAPGRKIVLSGDTAPCETLRVAAHQADVLVHEATFADEEPIAPGRPGHSTARQAAELARDAEVRLLALTHLSTRYAGGEIRDEARALRAHRRAARLRHDRGPVPGEGRARADAPRARGGAHVVMVKGAAARSTPLTATRTPARPPQEGPRQATSPRGRHRPERPRRVAPS